MTEPKPTIRPDRRPRIVALAALDALVAATGVALWLWAVRTRMPPAWAAAGAFTLLAVGAAGWVMRKVLTWDAAHWVGPYLMAGRYRLQHDRPVDLCFQFIDHFEPDHGRADATTQCRRVAGWAETYELAVAGHTDSDGRSPRHTWFFPIREHDPRVAKVLAEWPTRGWGEIEYHIHHDPAMVEDEFRRVIAEDIPALRQIGAVSSGRYAFVHGMFALAGGDPTWCRMAGELDVLRETGCYADFTFGSLGTPAQPRTVNAIYYAQSTGQPKPYDTGTECVVGGQGEGLLMIPGPMCFGLFPRVLDDAHVEGNHLPDPKRLDRWLDAHVHVRGRPNWIFVSVHSHTAPEAGHKALFGGAMQSLWSEMERRAAAGQLRLHYLTAREAYNVAKAAEAGHDGNPGDYRDYDVPPPAGATSARAATSASAKGPTP